MPVPTADPIEFLKFLLSENWNINTPGFKPVFVMGWLKPGHSVWPALTISGDLGTGIRTKGLPGKYHYIPDEYRITFHCLKSTQKWHAETEIKRIIVENCKDPATDKHGSSVGIEFLEVYGKRDVDNYRASPTIYRRDLFVKVHYQNIYA